MGKNPKPQSAVLKFLSRPKGTSVAHRIHAGASLHHIEASLITARNELDDVLKFVDSGLTETERAVLIKTRANLEMARRRVRKVKLRVHNLPPDQGTRPWPE